MKSEYDEGFSDGYKEGTKASLKFLDECRLKLMEEIKNGLVSDT